MLLVPRAAQPVRAALQETRNHVSRLERVFSILGQQPDTQDNDILDQMTKHAERMVKAIGQPAKRDASLVVSGNAVEHYEMAIYGSLVARPSNSARRNLARARRLAGDPVEPRTTGETEFVFWPRLAVGPDLIAAALGSERWEFAGITWVPR
jgi:Domain of unknown function (DUF892)